MSNNILLVDDDTNVLSACRRQLRREFSLDTAEGPEEGLHKLQSDTEYAVVLSDMQMPGMNGVEFLQQVRQQSPDSVRMMLTGNADQHTASAAINDGAVFRFLTKPCSGPEMAQALTEALRQYHLAQAEKELLENTLTGSIAVLADILSMTNPLAFGRSTAVQDYVRRLCEHVPVERRWELDIAAMLSQLGCVTIPENVLENSRSGTSLSETDAAMITSHPGVAAQLLRRIPRLEGAADLIQAQHSRPSADRPGLEKSSPELRLLHAALLLEDLLQDSDGPGTALAELNQHYDYYGPELIEACSTVIQQLPSAAQEVLFADLHCGMVLAEPLQNDKGQTLVAPGQEITDTILLRIRNFATNSAIQEPIRVFMSS